MGPEPRGFPAAGDGSIHLAEEVAELAEPRVVIGLSGKPSLPSVISTDESTGRSYKTWRIRLVGQVISTDRTAFARPNPIVKRERVAAVAGAAGDLSVA